jgi:hypothetical protein
MHELSNFNSKFVETHKHRTPSFDCDSAAVAAAATVRGEVAGILEKSHKVEKNWKNSI